jgi:hypothetical protein
VIKYLNDLPTQLKTTDCLVLDFEDTTDKWTTRFFDKELMGCVYAEVDYIPGRFFQVMRIFNRHKKQIHWCLAYKNWSPK